MVSYLPYFVSDVFRLFPQFDSVASRHFDGETSKHLSILTFETYEIFSLSFSLATILPYITQSRAYLRPLQPLPLGGGFPMEHPFGWE
jgi:hypothetical protein